MPSEDLNQILEIYQQAADHHFRSAVEVWRNRYPKATDEELAGWEVFCKEVELQARLLAQQVVERTISRCWADVELGARFPALNSECACTSMAQAIKFRLGPYREIQV